MPNGTADRILECASLSSGRILTIPSPLAGDAYTSAQFGNPGIDDIVGMSKRALCSSGISCRGSCSPKQVDAICDRFHVRRVHAGRRPAQVINDQPRHQRAIGKFPRETVCVEMSRVISGRAVKDTVSTSISCALPQPTGFSFENLLPKPNAWGMTWLALINTLRHGVSVPRSIRVGVA